jgi:hypothetical protein
MNATTTPRHLLPARLKAIEAAARSTPKMHWRWRQRGHDINILLQSRFGSALPDDDAGIDAAKLIAQHYMRLNIDAERVTRANLRLWSPWLTGKITTGFIKAAKTAKTPSAAQLGKAWRVTADEVAAHNLKSIRAFIGNKQRTVKVSHYERGSRSAISLPLGAVGSPATARRTW